MNLLLLGHGKTGSLVAEVAKELGHSVQVLTSRENQDASALTKPMLSGVDAVIDFTTPAAALENIRACIAGGVRMVVGTTGWYSHLEEVRHLVRQHKAGFVYAPNFSIGVNVFFNIAAAAAEALRHGYSARIMERHHAGKKDSPSGTAASLQQILAEQSGRPNSEIEITSIREGEVAGQHVLLLDAENDTMMLVHDAKSRRGFAQGAIFAAEWLQGKTGFYSFREVISVPE